MVNSSRVPAYDWLEKFALNFSSQGKLLFYSISLGFGLEASFFSSFFRVEGITDAFSDY